MVILSQVSITAFEELRQNSRWLGEMDAVMQRAAVPALRREAYKALLLAFLIRFRSRPQALERKDVRGYVRAQAEAGLGSRTLLDLLQSLGFFFESVLPRPDLAAVAGHPFQASAWE